MTSLTCVTAVRDVIARGNQEQLSRCLASVSRVSLPHEHLVYDGGSTDGTVHLLRELESTLGHCFRWTSERDHGIYEALNKGVHEAGGEWFYVLGCDDWISDPEALARTLEGGGTADALASPVVYSNGEVWLPARKIVLAAMPCSHQGLLVRTSVMRELGGFSADYRMAADFDLMQRLAFAGYDMREFQTPYATFGVGGFSQNEEIVRAENAALLKRRFRLSEKELGALWPQRILPFRALGTLLCSSHAWLRRAAWYQLLRLVFYRLGLMKRNGKLVLSH